MRTVPEKIYGFLPRGDFRILEAYTRALRAAGEFVYLESQFLWSPQIVELLAGKLRDPPSDRFRVVVLLPAKPNNGADDTRGQLAALVRADDGAGRFLATTISARTGELSGPLYVHAKIGIVDDAWLTLGSANLNEHSLFNDTEMNIVSCDRAIARGTRLRLWSEHLERSIDDVSGEPARGHRQLWRPTPKSSASGSSPGAAHAPADEAAGRLASYQASGRSDARPARGRVGRAASSAARRALATVGDLEDSSFAFCWFSGLARLATGDLQRLQRDA